MAAYHWAEATTEVAVVSSSTTVLEAGTKDAEARRGVVMAATIGTATANLRVTAADTMPRHHRDGFRLLLVHRASEPVCPLHPHRRTHMVTVVGTAATMAVDISRATGMVGAEAMAHHHLHSSTMAAAAAAATRARVTASHPLQAVMIDTTEAAMVVVVAGVKAEEATATIGATTVAIVAKD